MVEDVRALKILSKSDFQAHADLLFHKFNMLKVSDVCALQSDDFVFNSVYGPNTQQKEACKYFNFTTSNTHYFTRSKSTDVIIPYCRTDIRGNSIACKGPLVCK